jgi:hypothetical protein
MQYLEKLFWDVLVVLLGQLMIYTLVADLLMAVAFGYWVWRRIKDKQMLASQIGIGVGIAMFAFLLIIDNQLKAQAAHVEHKASAEAEAAQKTTTLVEIARKEKEKSSPEYLERKVRDWFERVGYPTQHHQPRGQEAFHVSATGEGVDFTVIMDKGVDSVAMMRAFKLARMVRRPKQCWEC